MHQMSGWHTEFINQSLATVPIRIIIRITTMENGQNGSLFITSTGWADKSRMCLNYFLVYIKPIFVECVVNLEDIMRTKVTFY